MDQTEAVEERQGDNRLSTDPQHQRGDASDPSRSSQAMKTEIPDDMLKSISDISQSASYAYVLYLSFLAYCALTILTTTDEHIIRNDTTVLPLVSLNVPFSIFFRVAPLIAIGLFIYFELYHNRVTEMLTEARRNYAPIDKRKLYPWLVTLGEQPDTGMVGKLERLVVTFSLWWTLPIVLWLFAFWTLRKHALSDCLFIAVVNLLGAICVFGFWRLYQPSASVGRQCLLVVAIICQGGLLGLLIFVILQGYPAASYVMAPQSSTWVEAVTSYAAVKVRTYTAVDFRYTDFTDAHSLEGVHLEGAQLENADFRGAYLSNVSMRNANLNLADLEESDLTSAALDGADLLETRLARSNISSATLVNAWMVRANLNHALAVAVNFRDANLAGADLEGANLAGADLEGANLQQSVNLTIDQLGSACTLYQAQIDNPLLHMVKSKHPNLFKQPRRNANGSCETSPS